MNKTAIKLKKPEKKEKKPIQMSMEGFEVVEKRAESGGNSARIYVPKRWLGKKVRAVLIEEK